MRMIKNPIVIGSLLIVFAVIVASCAAISAGTGNESSEQSVTEAAADTGSAEDGAAETVSGVELLPAEDPPARLLRSSWSTDFSKRTVAWNEILSGGPPKDGIPAIDDPTSESIEEAAQWLTDRDPVILFQNNGEARAYPLAILIWHEIANDEVGGLPVAVSFCPLCNASIVFNRSFNGETLDFGTTGLLRNSDLVMYDRQTETWWQQFIGQGIVGELAGAQLKFLPSQVISFGDFRAEFPEGDVLARPAAARSYGVNPYTNYDSTSGRPFLYSGELDTRLPATERIVGVELEDAIIAYPFSALAEVKVVNDQVGGVPIVVFHKSGTASALDTRNISEGKDIGSAAVFNRTLGDLVLRFEPGEDGTFRDAETGSTWNIFGEATDGELAGRKLEQIQAFDHFWFAWSAFFPDTGLYEK